MSGCLDALRAGNWEVLQDGPLGAPPESPAPPQRHAPPVSSAQSRQPVIHTTESIKNNRRILTFHFGGEHGALPVTGEELRGEVEHEV